MPFSQCKADGVLYTGGKATVAKVILNMFSPRFTEHQGHLQGCDCRPTHLLISIQKSISSYWHRIAAISGHLLSLRAEGFASVPFVGLKGILEKMPVASCRSSTIHCSVVRVGPREENKGKARAVMVLLGLIF
jgi:hypothetical protein